MTPEHPDDFIRQRVRADVQAGRNGGRVHTRFPPEPNGYLHIGHAKSICLNFGLAEEFGGKCNLRFDDTNPETEDPRYVEAIVEDVRWLGFDWEDRCYFASDYFERFYELAVQLVKQGDAYVDSQTPEQIKEGRGTGEKAGVESPHRDRPVEENLDLLERMRRGEFAENEHVLRARIDMASPSHILRDPPLYRIRHHAHYRTGDQWCLYPMYDFAHGFEDSIEGITHSLCTLEFEMHRPLYDWLLERTGVHHPQQIEFARLNLTRTVMSKRKLLRLVDEGHVAGWDDPRLPTLAGMRRRGYPPAALRAFCDHIGISKFNSTHDMRLLQHFVREHLNRIAQRRLAVLDPLKVVITNLGEDHVEELEAVNNPEDEAAGTRRVPFTRELWIERDDFMEDPPKKFFRLAPGKEVRLRFAYFLRCDEVVKDGDGTVVELRCTYDPETRGGKAPDGRKVKGTIHWVSAAHARTAEVRLYGDLLRAPEDLDEAADLVDQLDPENLVVVRDARIEPALAEARPGEPLQFERTGYFCADPDGDADRPVFNRTVPLKSSYKP